MLSCAIRCHAFEKYSVQKKGGNFLYYTMKGGGKKAVQIIIKEEIEVGDGPQPRCIVTKKKVEC